MAQAGPSADDDAQAAEALAEADDTFLSADDGAEEEGNPLSREPWPGGGEAAGAPAAPAGDSAPRGPPLRDPLPRAPERGSDSPGLAGDAGRHGVFDFDELSRRMCGEEEGEPRQECEDAESAAAEPAEAAAGAAEPDAIPRMADLLKDLEEDEVRADIDRAQAYGVPVLDLETAASLNQVLNRLDALEKMTFSQLRGEYESRGFVTPDSLMSRRELLPSVRDVIIWEALSVKGLVKVCQERGVAGAHEGMDCKALLSLLAEPSWKAFGISTQSFEDVAEAEAVLQSVRGLETRDRQELVSQCRQLGLPVGARLDCELIEELRKALVWSRLPESELLAECRRLGLEPPGPQLAAPAERTQKQALYRRLTSTLWGTWGPKLECLELTEAFMKQFERADTISLSSLKTEFIELNLYAHPKMQDAELANVVKQSVIWRQLTQDELRHECANMELPADLQDSDEAMRQRLLQKMCMAIWDSRGLLPPHVSDYDTVVRIMQQWQTVDTMTLTDLKRWYTSLGFPEERDIEREQLLELAHKIAAWQELSLGDLEEECRRQDMALPPEDSEASDRKQALVDALTCRNRMDTWDAKGFQASRIKDSRTAMQIVELFDRYQAQPFEDLKKLCLDGGVPAEALRDRTQILGTLKTLLIWELLPLEELREECRARSVPTETESQNSEEAHTELYQRLRVDLRVKLCRSMYEEKGIPVERLSSLSAATVLAQYEVIEGQTGEELREWYTGQLRFPEEAAMQREELVKVAKLLAFWHELDQDELLKECEAQGVKLQADQKGDKQQMVDQLLFSERMEAWEGRGYRSKAIGDIKRVAQVVEQCEAWQKMGQAALKKVLAGGGYLDGKGAGHSKLASLDRDSLLKVCKALIIWELLPMEELKKDCSQRQLRLENAGRDECLRWLVRASSANTWSVRGIPAERLRSLEVTQEIIDEVDKIEAAVTYHEMIGQGERPLRKEYEKMKLPFDPKLDSQAHIDRLRDLLVWNSLPMLELQRECRAHGVSPEVSGLRVNSSSGFTPPAALQGPPGAKGRRPFLGTDHLRPQGGKSGTMPGMPQILGKAGKGSHLASLVGRKAPAPGNTEVLGKAVKASETLGRLAQTKEAAEEEVKARRVLVERLVLATWRSTWKPRGIPAERLQKLEVAEPLIGEIDRVDGLSMAGLEAEYEKVGLVFSRLHSREVLIGRLRNIIIWQSVPEVELRREYRALLKKESSEDTEFDRGDLMERLLEHTILMESEAQGIPVFKLPDSDMAFRTMETIDQSFFESLKDWYKSIGLPQEQCIERPELVRLAKLVSCWQELPLDELMKECERVAVRVKASDDDQMQQVKQAMTDALLMAERRQTWDARGYQASRIGDDDAIFKLVSAYEDYGAQSDEELRQCFEKMGMPCEDVGREELLRMMKTMLVWEHLPLEEVKKECQEKNLPIAEVAAEHEGNEEEILSELVHLLQVDLRVEQGKDNLESKGIPVKRMGSLGAARAASQILQMEGSTMEELRSSYSSMGFLESSALDRQHILDVLKQIVVWECMPLTELQKDCLDRDVPLHVDLDPSQEAEEGEEGAQSLGKKSPKQLELIHRLTIDLHVIENKGLYLGRGIPVSRLNSQKAYSLLMKFNDIDEYDIDALRGAQQDHNLPPAPNMSRDELLSRLKDAAIWTEFSADELQKECRIRNLTLLMPAVVPGQPKPAMRDVLLDTLLLNRCAKTYDELEVPWKQLKTAKAAVHVAIAWDELEGMPPSELRARYHSIGLSPNLLETKEIKQRLKTVAVYLEIPLEELQRFCASHGVSPGSEPRRDLVRRLTQTLWPMKVEPPKPKPPPPRPPPPPPPPRQPSMATGRLRLAHYFQVLQLPPNAGIEEVKKAYRRLALKHHPDKNRGEQDEKAASVAFLKVAEAYEKLSEFFLDKPK